ncbi:hypothetical protein D8S93_24565 [Vibrio sp. VGrn 2]|nr:hypothetical protein [Vibrio sp. VGrn 2]
MISKIQPHRFSSKHAVKVTKIEMFKFKFEVALTHFGAKVTQMLSLKNCASSKRAHMRCDKCNNASQID